MINLNDQEGQYKIIMTNRETVLIEGVENVESFDEEEILLETKMGLLILKGQGMHVVQLNLENGVLLVNGYCKSLEFSDEKNTRGFKNKSKGFLHRILK
ncbi:sporulation protein YabP [Phosphitispora sp. TUW77]|uniref:sporulation protein YabP n=1 Tax=Phosphitispora sp. TUW77 TaxID=3152361 RepID=UPI003AB56204